MSSFLRCCTGAFASLSTSCVLPDCPPAAAPARCDGTSRSSSARNPRLPAC
ncbi:Uncharacterised protein [Mycobacteroides abscessus subsp. abscessus]|nr:Uncharacterised protein [Mycobacteroides abscessus subsp. abscessus]